MRLLVTGGAGYIGSVVVRQLLAAGHDVAVLDNLSRGHRAAVPADCALLEADLLDVEGTSRAVAGRYEGVLHFAALSLVAESVEHPERYWYNNLLGTRHLLDAMRTHGVGRLVFSSTAAVYGEPERVPIHEDAPTAPVNAYGASKLAVDMMIETECRAHGLGATSLRYFNVAGTSGDAGEHHEPETHVIPLLLQAAAGRREYFAVFGTDYATPDGTAIRDYVHVEDLGAAHLLALDAIADGRHEIYNLGNGAGFSVRQVLEAGERVVGRPIPSRDEPRRAGDPPELVAASDKIRRELGWEARRPELEAMIADAWEWAQAHPDGYAD
jgi:UDP-glucose 4-epimerase